MSLKAKTHAILEGAPAAGAKGSVVNNGLFALIALNVAAAIVDTMAVVQARFGDALRIFELVSVTVFGVEYVARVWASTCDERYPSPLMGRLRFMASPMAIIDLVAILPALLGFLGIDLRQLRALRLFRLLRAGKLVRYSRSLQLIGRVLKKRRGELVGTCVLMFALLIFGSTLLYWAERDAQPEAFESIPATMWWAVATLTTVGYGDITPITPLGKFFGAFVAIFGIGLFALPTGVLGAAFVEEMRRDESDVCPHCGKNPAEPVDGWPSEDMDVRASRDHDAA
jgi:voltage-gated potassium channel